MTLLDEERPAGEHTVVCSGSNTDGQPVATGVYFYHFTAGEFEKAKKMLLLK